MSKPMFSGGEVRIRPQATYGSAVWNRDPLPPPPPPPIYTYRLVVHHPEEAVPATATATSFEELIEFEQQMRALGYTFIKLERVDPTDPTMADAPNAPNTGGL